MYRLGQQCVILFCAIFLAGCFYTGGAADSELGKANEGEVLQLHTVMHLDTGPEDLGVRPWHASTIEFMQRVPVAGFSLDDNGRIKTFAPARPPLAGVEPPPEGVAIGKLHFDGNGRLSGWEEADELADCVLKKLLGSYYCEPVNCPNPNLCVVTFVYDSHNNLIDVYCVCEVTP